MPSNETHPCIFPALRYQDANAAIDWLCRAFGFSARFVGTADDGTVAHAQLVIGNGMVMLATEREGDDFPSRSSKSAGSVTQTIYVFVADIDAHHEQAQAAGAEIFRPLSDTDYGSREYSAYDPEGHVWSFGTYQPFAEVPG